MDRHSQQLVVEGELGRWHPHRRCGGDRRDYGGAGHFEIGYAAGIEHAGEMIGERRLAALHGGEMQQPDIHPARLARFEPLIECLPGAAEGRAWEQLVAEYRMPERLRLPD